MVMLNYGQMTGVDWRGRIGLRSAVQLDEDEERTIWGVINDVCTRIRQVPEGDLIRFFAFREDPASWTLTARDFWGEAGEGEPIWAEGCFCTTGLIINLAHDREMATIQLLVNRVLQLQGRSSIYWSTRTGRQMD